MTGHEYAVRERAKALPVVCDIQFAIDEIDQSPKTAHILLNQLKTKMESDFIIFCLRCSDHPKFGSKGVKTLGWWKEKLHRTGFEFHEAYSNKLCEGTDWYGIIVCRVIK